MEGSCHQVRAGVPEGAVAEALERMGQVTAALWRQNDKQGKKKAAKKKWKKREKERKLKREKRKKSKGRECMVRIWYLIPCGGYKEGQTQTPVPLAWWAGESPPSGPIPLLGLFCPTPVTLSSPGLEGPAPETAGCTPQCCSEGAKDAASDSLT